MAEDERVVIAALAKELHDAVLSARKPIRMEVRKLLRGVDDVSLGILDFERVLNALSRLDTKQ